MNTELLHQDIEMIYACASDPSLWEQCLAQISRGIGAKAGILSIDRLDNYCSAWSIRSNSSPDMLEAYEKDVETDIWVQALVKHPQNQFRASDQLVPQKTFLGSSFHHNYTKHADIYYAAGMHFATKDDQALRVSFQRGKSQGSFEYRELDYLNALLPHIRRALDVSRRIFKLELDQKVHEAFLNQIDHPLLVLDSERRIQHLNSDAERLLSSEAWLSVHNMHLTKIEGLDEMAFNKAITNATFSGSFLLNDDSCVRSFLRSNKGDPMQTWLIEVHRCNLQAPTSGFLNFMPPEPHCLVSFRSLKVPTERLSQRLVELYDMSASESAVACLLAEGLAAQEIAHVRQRSPETIRTQIKSIHAKLGVSSSAQAIALLNGLS